MSLSLHVRRGLSVEASIERYYFERPIVPWVYAIASNKLKDHWRRRGLSLASTSLDAVGEEPSQPDPDEGAIGGERQDQLERGLQNLPEDLRLIVELRVFQDLPYAEVARVLELSEPATRKRFSRAIGALRSALEGPATASS